MVIVVIARAAVVIPMVVPVIVSMVIPVVVPVSGAIAMVHAVSGPAVSPVAIIDHATGHGTERQNDQEYRCNELLHGGFLVAGQTTLPGLGTAIFCLAARAICALAYL
jgi:hypothetical protein